MSFIPVAIFTYRGTVLSPANAESIRISVLRPPRPHEDQKNPGAFVHTNEESYRIFSLAGADLETGDSQELFACFNHKSFDSALRSAVETMERTQLSAAHDRWRLKQYEGMGFWKRLGFLFRPGHTVRSINDKVKEAE